MKDTERKALINALKALSVALRDLSQEGRCADEDIHVIEDAATIIAESIE